MRKKTNLNVEIEREKWKGKERKGKKKQKVLIQKVGYKRPHYFEIVMDKNNQIHFNILDQLA